jgi:hypothetical protein
MGKSNRPNFDHIARPYRLLEFITFGHTLERCRTHYLPRLLDHSHALILGDGDGRFLAALLVANPKLQADAVDTGATMLQLLRRRALAATPDADQRLRTHHTSALTFTPSQPCDLVVTHFFLDCLTQPELDRLCQCLTPHLIPGALWLLSDFRIPPTGTMHWPARALVRSLYLGFRLLTGLRTTQLPDHAAALTAVGLTRIACRHLLGGLLTTELWLLDANPHHSQEYTSPMLPPQRPSSKSHLVEDPVPNPEPASPSLPGPDPGIYHRDPSAPTETPPVEPPKT